MIHESIRQMSAEEHASLAAALRPVPGGFRPYTIRPIAVAVLGCVAFAGAWWMVVASGTHDPQAWISRILGMASIASFWYAARSLPRYLRVRRWHTHHFSHRRARLAQALEDGRVRVRRVSAVAAVAIEPVDDEGSGYLFDLGDGQVLFLKGSHLPDVDAEDEGEPWPCTQFELVERVADGGFVHLACTGHRLPPVRVIRRGEYDDGELWEERDEVLRMSLDETVRTIVRAP